MRRSRKKRVPSIIPTVSMGDIAFLLIIFFVLVSNFAKDKAVQMEPPKTVYLSELKKTPIMVQIDKEGRIYVDDKMVSAASDVESLVSSQVGNKPPGEQRWVTFKADKSLDRSVFEPVIEAISRAGGTLALIGEKKP